jgi:SAM-dependent methyltransferase
MSQAHDTLERIVPAEMNQHCPVESESLRLHMERYEFALRHLRPGRVLDIACGVGYGTAFLAEQSKHKSQFIGVDCAVDAIGYARQCFSSDDVEYVLADALSYHDSAGFDSVVSLESIEHMADPGEFVDHLVSLLAPGGTLIASVPTTLSTDGNPHHLHDFTEKTFRDLFTAHPVRELANLPQVQPFRIGQAGRDGRLSGMRQNLPLYYLKHPDMFLKRIYSLLRNGLNNRYLTVAWKKEKCLQSLP